MLIQEVEHIVNLSKKSIRFYEDNGLLTPKRNANNQYRIYSEDDVKKLKIIKFLRELGVPIRELKLLDNHKLSLENCMQERIKRIKIEQSKYDKVLSMCNEIIKSGETYENIDIENYFLNMNVLNKEGFTMREIKSNHKKKILGAILSSCIFSMIFLFLIVIITYLGFFTDDNIPIILYLFLMFILGIPTLAIFYNLFIRIKEIRRGEEDEASKY